MATNLYDLFKPLSFPVSHAHFWLRHRCFLRVSPKPSSLVASSHSGIGAFLWISPEPSSLRPLRLCLLFCVCLVGTCGLLHVFVQTWCLTSLFVVADITSLTSLFSWLKGVPPGINPSSRQQKKSDGAASSSAGFTWQGSLALGLSAHCGGDMVVSSSRLMYPSSAGSMTRAKANSGQARQILPSIKLPG